MFWAPTVDPVALIPLQDTRADEEDTKDQTTHHKYGRDMVCIYYVLFSHMDTGGDILEDEDDSIIIIHVVFKHVFIYLQLTNRQI